MRVEEIQEQFLPLAGGAGDTARSPGLHVSHIIKDIMVDLYPKRFKRNEEEIPWALMEMGFHAIIAPSFADIFRNNCMQNGLLPVVLEESEVDTVIARALAQKLSELAALRRSLPDGLPEYERLLRRAMEFCECASRRVSELLPPTDAAAAERDTLAESLRLFQTGLADYLGWAEARDWVGIHRGSPLLERAAKLLVPLLR